jgi:hypothetical protein
MSQITLYDELNFSTLGILNKGHISENSDMTYATFN